MGSKITLYPHQNESISAVRSELSKHRRVLLQSPTGSGKTIMAAFIINSAKSKGNTIFFVCHRRELINQTAGTFTKLGIEFGVIAAGHKKLYDRKVQICSIDTLKNRLSDVPEPKLILWDECQHIAANGWAKTQEYFDKAFHIGLSATPDRLSGEGLDKYFDEIVLGKPVRWLIDNGFLADYRLFSIPGVDMTGAHTRAGEYTTADSDAAMDKPAIIGDIVKHWKKYASDKLTIGFASSLNMSKKYVDAFNAAGIPAAHLDGETKDTVRYETLQAFARGEIRIVFNKMLFGEGFDISANSGMDVTIGCVIDAAPTQAVSMWLQRCGRGLRKQEGKAIILDHAGNFGRHGLPDQHREWTLEGRKKQKRDEEANILVKQCEQCYCCHKPAPICPECGFVYPIVERKIEHVDGELQEVIQQDIEKRKARQQQGQAQTVQDLINLGMGRARATKIVQSRKDKEKLQNEYFDLCHAKNIKVVKSSVLKMKPKELKKGIEEMKGL